MVGQLRWALRSSSPRSAGISTWPPEAGTGDGPPEAIGTAVPRPGRGSSSNGARSERALRGASRKAALDPAIPPADGESRWPNAIAPENAGDRQSSRRGTSDRSLRTTVRTRPPTTAFAVPENGAAARGNPGVAGDPRPHDAEERELERGGRQKDRVAALDPVRGEGARWSGRGDGESPGLEILGLVERKTGPTSSSGSHELPPPRPVGAARKAKLTMSSPSSEAIELPGRAGTTTAARSRSVRTRSAGGSGPEVAGVVPPPGFRHLPGWLDRRAQAELLAELLALVEPEGWFQPVMPRTGRPFSVRMANLGPLGWVSDLRGYRYQPTHPRTGRPWPPIPERLLALWRELVGEPEPECCLVNFYGPAAKMGLHRDADEDARDVPVLSISLGDTAIFRVGGLARRGPTVTLRLASGDVVLLAGESRHAFHGIDRILPGSSDLLPGGGRINLTLRRVTRPDGAKSGKQPGLIPARRREAGPRVP